MKIAPLRITDPWFHRLARHGKADVQTLRAVPCDIAVRMEAVSILHHGIDQNYRPYLHLRGRLAQVQPDVELPYGITELPFRRGAEPVADAFYEFDSAQLAELVRKGYFGTRFRVPETMVGIVWELPAEADFLVVAPESTAQPPVVFVGVRDQNNLVLTEETSGYNLADYFPDYSLEDSVQASAGNELPVPTHSGAIQDLFADEKFEDADHRRPAGSARRDAAPGRTVQAPQGLFDKLMNEVEAERLAQGGTEKPGVDYDPDTPEGVLREWITPGVEQALSSGAREAVVDSPEHGTEHTRATASETGFLDLEEADETAGVGVAPVRTSIYQRAASDRQDEADDYQPGV
ncbi:AAA family ATPase [Nocardiopsis sp. N85]|uniref:AAA family ATPase n=1 Tax=Nocardiopsis sp. N85 TaxID=3029400 RepID=UPI00237F291E|nr:AAA family ATPase [Nocardiopsis sp. N85]MDE3723957.1 AAA family ATPase [Nocardiopsis sp. N85]